MFYMVKIHRDEKRQFCTFYNVWSVWQPGFRGPCIWDSFTGMSLSPMHWRHCLLLSHGITTLLLWTRGATAFRHLQQSTKDSNKAPFTAHELKWSGQVDPVTPLVMHIHSPAHATSTYFVLIGRRHSELCMYRSHSHSRIKTTLGMMLQQWRRVSK